MLLNTYYTQIVIFKKYKILCIPYLGISLGRCFLKIVRNRIVKWLHTFITFLSFFFLMLTFTWLELIHTFTLYWAFNMLCNFYHPQGSKTPPVCWPYRHFNKIVIWEYSCCCICPVLLWHSFQEASLHGGRMHMIKKIGKLAKCKFCFMLWNISCHSQWIVRRVLTELWNMRFNLT